MTINLSEIEFDNDFFTTTIPSGDELILNKIDESLKIDTEDIVVDIKNITIELVKTDNTFVSCPCVIGLGNEYLLIDTKYEELKGTVLTSDNMKYCTINVYD